MIEDVHLVEETANMTEDEDTIETKEENVGTAENNHTIEDKKEVETIEEEEEKDREIGMIDIVTMDHNNATSTRKQANAATESEQDMHVGLNTGNQRRKRTATLKVEDPRMAGR